MWHCFKSTSGLFVGKRRHLTVSFLSTVGPGRVGRRLSEDVAGSFTLVSAGREGKVGKRTQGACLSDSRVFSGVELSRIRHLVLGD